MDNFKQKRLLIIFIIILVILNITVLSVFWMSAPRHGMRGHPNGGKHDKGLEILTEKLDLSAEQQVTFKELRKTFFEETSAFQTELKNKKDLFFEEMTSEAAQDSIVFNRIEDAVKVNGDIDKALFRHYKKMMENCDAEQKEVLRNMFAEMMKRQHHRKGKPPHQK